jgi:ABC-type glutathione transport system ATPase component
MAKIYKVVTVADPESGLKEIDSFVELSKVRGVLAIVGESSSGKTTLVKRYLRSRGLSEDRHYLNVNDFIMTKLKQRQDYKALELDDRRGFLERNKRIIERALSEKLYDHFQDNKILVLDSIELLFKYEVNLAALTYEPASGGRTCIICIPGSISGEKIYFMGKPAIISYHHCDKIIQIERR